MAPNVDFDLNSKLTDDYGLNDPMAVVWAEKHNERIALVWNKLPKVLSRIIVSVCVFLFGLSINGEWLNIGVHIMRQFRFSTQAAISSNATFKWSEMSLESLKLQNLHLFAIPAFIVSYAMYFLIGGFLHWYFYVRQRDRAHEWKCQPTKWLSPELERHEMMVGSATLLVNALLSSMLSCYISNGGYNTVYYDFNETYPWWWFFLQVPVVFVYQDYTTYLIHRLYHTPFFYKHFHKMHHKYKQPTAFSVSAIHPLEAAHIQLNMCLPLFVIPVHWALFYVNCLYIYYHGIIVHSGINFKAFWWQPWQPDAIFHDNHHQYFHVNFGFNCFWWDKIHGTYRRKDRIYTEKTFSGRGKPIEEATDQELADDIGERLSENPLAYRSNTLEYQFSDEVLQRKTK